MKTLLSRSHWPALALLIAAPCGFLDAKPGKEKITNPQIYTWDWMQDQDPRWYEPTPGVIDTALKGALGQAREIIFATRGNGRDWHWYANFGYNIENENRYYHGGNGGSLRAINPRTREVRIILEDAEGDIRDPAVHYDGETILFSYRPGDTNQFHLYTIKADGTELTQLTDSDRFDDYEPCWLPNGDIMFVSSRCMRWVPCWYSQVGTTYRCAPDGSQIRQISFGVEHENTPWPLQDGRVAYTRWEYTNRDQISYHGMWTFNPDGTNQMVLLNNRGLGDTLHIGAKPVPGTDLIASISSPRHGRNEQRGRIIIQDPAFGPTDERGLRFLDRGYAAPKPKEKPQHLGDEAWRDPFPLSDNCYLLASLRRLIVMNGEGDYEILYEIPDGEAEGQNLHEPRPLIPHPPAHIIPDRVHPGDRGMGEMVLGDILHGRTMEGLEPGTIKKLLIKEETPRPVAKCAYGDAIGQNYTLHRVLGTVPVEEDGSAYFEVPAGRPLVFVALDENDVAVKHMNSFVSVMPGEQVSCVGCHEERTVTARDNYSGLVLAAMDRDVSKIEPLRDQPRLFDYLRDIQPIWNRHCVECHNMEDYAGNMSLEDDMGLGFSISYHQLREKRGMINVRSSGDDAPYSKGSGGSQLVKVLSEPHHDVNLSPRELRRIKLWLDVGASFAGSYAAVGSASRDLKIQVSDEVAQMYVNRCGECHNTTLKKPMFTGEIRRLGEFNVSRPEKSLLLMAPLAKSAGGLGLCRPKKEKEQREDFAVIESKDDPAWKLLEQVVTEAVQEHGGPRWFEEEFAPRDFYVREMKRFEVLPEDYDPDTEDFDPYQIDAAYFRKLYEHGPGPVELTELDETPKTK